MPLAKLESLNVHLQNMNGLLNLVAWCKTQKGHLIPHGQLPDEFGQSGGKSILIVEQNALRGIRHDAATRVDRHVVQHT